MKKIHLIIVLMLSFVNAHSQIDVNATYIKENNNLKFTITNKEDKTIAIADIPIHPEANKVWISLYPKDDSAPYKEWYGYTLGAKERSNIIILKPNESYSHTYTHLTSCKKGPYSKIEVTYCILYGFYEIPIDDLKPVVGTKEIKFD